MNAITINEIGNSSVLKYQPILKNDLMPNEVRIKVTAAAVNYIDTLIRSGNMPPGMMPELPFIPGVECIGIVEEVNQGATQLKVGEKVAYFGNIGASTYADYVVTNSNQLVKIPHALDDAEAAVVPVNYSTAYHMLHNIAKIKEGDTIFVHAAAGGVGTAIIQLASIIGATIIGSVSSEAKKQYILKEGADYAIDYKKENILESVEKITNGKGVNVSFNPVAGHSMISDLNILAPFGHLVIFGFITGLPKDKLQEAMLVHFGKSLTVSYSDIYTLYNNDFDALRSILSTLFDYLRREKIAPKVYRKIPLPDAALAHNMLESGSVAGKLILIP